jgi:hypothetical protein
VISRWRDQHPPFGFRQSSVFNQGELEFGGKPRNGLIVVANHECDIADLLDHWLEAYGGEETIAPRNSQPIAA